MPQHEHTQSTKAIERVAVKKFLQSTALCGPASLKILLSHFGKDFSEAQLAELARSTATMARGGGTEHKGLIDAAKKLKGRVFSKEHGTIEELEYFVNKEKLPVIVGWFDKDGDHYSVVVSVTDKNIIIVDPAVDEPERWLDRAVFPKIWFDFVGKDDKVVSWGWYMVVTFDKRKFEVKGGKYH